MPETDYLKVPADRVGVLIGTKGETKNLSEKGYGRSSWCLESK